MSFVSTLALYFLLWWLCLFVVLPFGTRSQIEDKAVTLGTEPGAPGKTHIGRKLLINSALAGVVLALYWLITAKFSDSLYNLQGQFYGR